MAKKDKNGLTIAGRMEFVRRLLDFTRKEWAEELNTSAHTIENIEYEKQRISEDILSIMSEKFPHVVNYILTGDAEVKFTEEEKNFIKSLEKLDTDQVKKILNSKQKRRF